MAGAIQNACSPCEPIECNRRRLAGLRSSLNRQRKSLTKAKKNRVNQAKIIKSVNRIIEKIAVEYLNADKLSEAYDLFFWLPDDETHSQIRYQGMSDCLFRLNQHQDARDLVEVAIKIYPEDSVLRGIYLKTLVVLDDYEKCLDIALESLILFPDEVEFSFYLAQSYEFLEQYDVAESIYRAILKDNPEDAMLHEKIARCLIGKGRTAEAIPILIRGKRVSPEYSGCYYELAAAYTMLDQYDKALRVARKAFRLFYATDGCAYACFRGNFV